MTEQEEMRENLQIMIANLEYINTGNSKEEYRNHDKNVIKKCKAV